MADREPVDSIDFRLDSEPEPEPKTKVAISIAYGTVKKLWTFISRRIKK